MQGPNTLLVIAHRPEAQAFLKNDSLSALEGITPNLYQAQEYYLLIAGEGITNALQNTSLALSQIGSINQVWNLGIAGGLDQNSITKDEIYKIRTCYGELGNEVQFKSFTSAFNGTVIDCMTSSHRVLNKEKTNKLSNFALVVDRESWAIGIVCKQLKIDFYPAKLISDFPQEEKSEICTIVKEKAELYSDQLYRWWSVHHSTKRLEIKEKYTPLFPELYFTLSMERKLNQLIETLTLKNSSLSDLITKIKDHVSYEELLASSKTDKQKTLLFLDNLKTLINPKLSKVDRQLELLSREMKREGASLSFDPALEGSYINLKIQLKNDTEKDNLISSLKRFSFSKLKEILEGKSFE